MSVKILDICHVLNTKITHMVITDSAPRLVYERKDPKTWIARDGNFTAVYRNMADTYRPTYTKRTKILTEKGNIELHDGYAPILSLDDAKGELQPVWVETFANLVRGDSRGGYMYVKKNIFDDFLQAHIPTDIRKYAFNA